MDRNLRNHEQKKNPSSLKSTFVRYWVMATIKVTYTAGSLRTLHLWSTMFFPFAGCQGDLGTCGVKLVELYSIWVLTLGLSQPE
jgi:hypothetical protein